MNDDPRSFCPRARRCTLAVGKPRSRTIPLVAILLLTALPTAAVAGNKGDLNLDCKVDLGDLVLLQSAVRGGLPLTPEQTEGADVAPWDASANPPGPAPDGEVGLADLEVLQRAVRGDLSLPFQPCGPWPFESDVGHDGLQSPCPDEQTFSDQGNWTITSGGLYENVSASRLTIKAPGVTVRCAKFTGPVFCKNSQGCGDLLLDWVTWDDVDAANALLLESSPMVKVSNSKAIHGFTDWIQGNGSFSGLEIFNVWIGGAHKTEGSHNDVMQMRGHDSITIERFYSHGGLDPGSETFQGAVSGTLFIEHELNVAYGGHRRWWIKSAHLGQATRELRFDTSGGCDTTPCVMDRVCVDDTIIDDDDGDASDSITTGALTPTGPGTPSNFDPNDHVGFWGNVRASDGDPADYLSSSTPIEEPGGAISWEPSCPFAAFRCPDCGYTP